MINLDKNNNMNSPWKFFTLEELKCKCGKCKSTGEEMDVTYMHKVDLLRQVYGSPLTVSSGYRCPAHNSEVSTTGQKGPHTTGKAIDFSISLEAAYRLIYIALQLDFTGIGIKQAGASEHRFIHIDGLRAPDGFPRPRIWTYNA